MGNFTFTWCRPKKCMLCANPFGLVVVLNSPLWIRNSIHHQRLVNSSLQKLHRIGIVIELMNVCMANAWIVCITNCFAWWCNEFSVVLKSLTCNDINIHNRTSEYDTNDDIAYVPLNMVVQMCSSILHNTSNLTIVCSVEVFGCCIQINQWVRQKR